jgi:hypothetical protein
MQCPPCSGGKTRSPAGLVPSEAAHIKLDGDLTGEQLGLGSLLPASLPPLFAPSTLQRPNRLLQLPRTLSVRSSFPRPWTSPWPRTILNLPGVRRLPVILRTVCPAAYHKKVFAYPASHTSSSSHLHLTHTQPPTAESQSRAPLPIKASLPSPHGRQPFTFVIADENGLLPSVSGLETLSRSGLEASWVASPT